MLGESCGNDVEDELVRELDDNPGTTTSTKFSVLHSHFCSDVAFDHWTTRRKNRALRKAFKVIELQACLRITALSRRDQDRKHIHFSIGRYNR